MKDGKCTHCNSTDVYVSDDPFYDSFTVKSDAGPDLFSIRCYLCLNCRTMEFEASENSAVIFGKGKPLRNELPKSSNWKKISQ